MFVMDFSHLLVCLCFILSCGFTNVSSMLFNGVLQQEIELSRQRHAGDVEQKRRLCRMFENKVKYMFCLSYNNIDITSCLDINCITL